MNFTGKRDISLSKEEAHSYLRTKRSFSAGIVCECCIHHCTAQEFDQYCTSRRKRRSVRDIITSYDVEISDQPNGIFTSEEVEQLYEDIDRDSKSGALQGDILPDDYKKMQKIEATKRENIDRKYSALLSDSTITKDNEISTLEHKSQSDPHPTTADIIVDTLKSHHKRRHRHNGRHRRPHSN